MGFSPLAQAVIVAVLAYASGLFLGLSARRGELGSLRSRAPTPQTPRRPEPLNRSAEPSIRPDQPSTGPSDPAPEPSEPLARAAEILARAASQSAPPPVERRRSDAAHVALPPGQHERRRSSRHGRRRHVLRDLRDSLPELSDKARRNFPHAVLLVVLVAIALGIITLVLDIQATALVRPH